MVQSARLFVSGQVQGVFFRRSAKEEADRLGIKGWIRNEADGSVNAMAIGPKDKLEKFIKWCKRGSPLAKVENVEVNWADDSEEFSNFDIL